MSKQLTIIAKNVKRKLVVETVVEQINNTSTGVFLAYFSGLQYKFTFINIFSACG
jgi:hypothetical protein